jgi:hypothetical protein
MWTGFIQLRIRLIVEPDEHGNEFWGSITGVEYLD